MDALDILQAVIGWMDNAGIQKHIETIPIHLSIVFIKHSPDEFGSIPQLHPYFLASVLIAEAIERIQASIAVPTVNLHSTSPSNVPAEQISYVCCTCAGHYDFAKYKPCVYIFININHVLLLRNRFEIEESFQFQ